MKVLEPGHEYELLALDQPQNGDPAAPLVAHLIFVKRDTPPEKYPGNVGHHPGTTVQEVCRVLIDRLWYVLHQAEKLNESTIEDEAAIAHLQMVIWNLEMRNAAKKGRILMADPDNIETLPVCPKCGHIECKECQ